jgi:YbgC/YbaW family acyl-CoA thioester hydrolase
LPYKHISTFQVRNYDCDAYGHLYTPNYLRYTGETSIHAMRAAGLDQEHLAKLGYAWRPSRFYIELLRPLYPGDLFDVNAQLVDQNQTLASWAYEFSKCDDEDANARAQMEFQFIALDNNLPTSVPEELSFPGIPDLQEIYSGIQIPPPSPKPPGAVSGVRKVEWRDVGPDGQLNSAAYLDYIVDFLMDVSTSCGWPHERYIEEGIIFLIRKQWLEVKAGVTIGDELRITTWISEWRRSIITRNFTIHRVLDNKLTAEARTLWVSIDLKSGKVVRIPEKARHDFESQMTLDLR